MGFAELRKLHVEKNPRRKNVGEKSGNFRSGCRSVWEISYEVGMTRTWSKMPKF